MTSKINYQKVNDIFQCKLILSNNKEFIIPLREDGYINATKLCQAAGKRMTKWKNSKETQELIKIFSLTKNESTKLIEIFQGGNKYNQGTWVHPDLGLHLAQWCSPSFSLQVSKWLKELIFTGNVEIGNEKNSEEIIEKLSEKLKQAEDIIISYDNENKHLMKKYNKLYQTHQAYLKRKELYKLKEGSCVYLLNVSELSDDILKIKIGHTGNITDRISGFRTINPFCKLLCVMYTQQNVTIESIMKLRYQKELIPNNSEFITGISKDTLVQDLIQFSDSLRVPYNFESQEELEKFNRHIVPLTDIEKLEKELENEDIIEIDTEKFKRCGGFTHTTEESRILSYGNFFKNSNNKDGVARICKECFLVGRYGDKRKRRKVVITPEYDSSTHKWCNRCENVRSRDQFYKDTSTKDGISANCKTCKAEQKRLNRISKNIPDIENSTSP